MIDGETVLAQFEAAEAAARGGCIELRHEGIQAPHASDCATHDAPALDAGPCSCQATSAPTAYVPDVTFPRWVADRVTAMADGLGALWNAALKPDSGIDPQALAKLMPGDLMEERAATAVEIANGADAADQFFDLKSDLAPAVDLACDALGWPHADNDRGLPMLPPAHDDAV